jgi:uncharacterized membrane protein
MDSSVAPIIVIVLAVIFGVPVIALVALARVSALRRQRDEETPQVISRIHGLEKRVGELEQALRLAATIPAGQQPSEVEPHVHMPQGVPSPSVVPPALTAHVVAPPAAARTPALSTPRSSLASSSSGSAHDRNDNFEALVAGRWMNYVGILALVFAVTFFLKYAFDNDWVGPRGRVGIGLLLGSALYPWSQRLLNKGYKYFSEGIAGLGAVVLYLSLWAGWHYYQIFSQPLAFALMIVVTSATFVIAVGRDSGRLALLAQLGGLITLVLVSTGENHEVALFTYLLILGAAVLALAWVRTWKWLLPVQFAATLIYFWAWYGDFYREPEMALTIVFATLFFLLFAAIPMVRSWRDGELSEVEIGTVVINAISFAVALHQMLWPQHRWTLTVAIVALAAAHIGAERLLPFNRGTKTRVAQILFGGLALTFVTLAIPIRCDHEWITIAWAVEGLILVWSGFTVKIPLMRWAGLLLFGIVALRLATISIPANTFALNWRFATYLVAVGCFFASCYFAKELGADIDATEKTAYLITALAANILLIAALSLEVWDLFGRTIPVGIDRAHAQELALSSLWLVYALALLAVGAVRKLAVVRWQALTLLGVVIVKVFVFDLSFLEKFYRIVSFSLLGLALLLISFYYQRELAGRGAEKKS